MVKVGQESALISSLIAVASVAIVEISIGLIDNSIAVISDGTHALFDSMIIVTLLVMLRLSLKPRDQEHTYGHGRLESIAAFIGGVLLFIVTILIIREAIIRLFSQVIITYDASIYAVIYAMIIAIFRVFIIRATNIHSKSLRVGFYDALADLGSSLIALTAVLLSNAGMYASDSIGSIILAGILLFLTSRLTYSTIMELTDAIDPMLVKRARDTILSIKGVKECKDIRMRRVSNDILVDLIVVLDNNLSFNNAHKLSNEIEIKLKEVINASMVMVHFEPAQYTATESMIRDIAREVEGVEDVHNIIVSETQEGKIISMHLQVDRRLSLVEAHEIADKVEEAIKARMSIANINIHIEPVMLEMKSMKRVDDKQLRSIIEMIAKEEGIKSINKLDIYSSNGMIRLDLNCGMSEHISIEEAHDCITRFERRLRDRFNAIVNIHTEPQG